MKDFRFMEKVLFVNAFLCVGYFVFYPASETVLSALIGLLPTFD